MCGQGGRSKGDKKVWEVERGSKKERMERPEESDETKKDKQE